jgi:ankyrin repeat protein
MKRIHINVLILIVLALSMSSLFAAERPRLNKYIYNITPYMPDNSPIKNLYIAIDQNDPMMVQKALDEGADINFMDEGEMTPLHVAIQLKKTQVIPILLNAKPSFKRGYDLREVPALAFLIRLNKDNPKKYASVIQSFTDYFDKPLLHIAAIVNDEFAVNELIRQGTDVNLRDKVGNTPLHEAAYYGNLDIVKILLLNGADINAKDKGGTTPLGKARAAGKIDIIQFLQAQGAQ